MHAFEATTWERTRVYSAARSRALKTLFLACAMHVSRKQKASRTKHPTCRVCASVKRDTLWGLSRHLQQVIQEPARIRYWFVRVNKPLAVHAVLDLVGTRW